MLNTSSESAHILPKFRPQSRSPFQLQFRFSQNYGFQYTDFTLAYLVGFKPKNYEILPVSSSISPLQLSCSTYSQNHSLSQRNHPRNTKQSSCTKIPITQVIHAQ